MENLVYIFLIIFAISVLLITVGTGLNIAKDTTQRNSDAVNYTGFATFMISYGIYIFMTIQNGLHGDYKLHTSIHILMFFTIFLLSMFHFINFDKHNLRKTEVNRDAIGYILCVLSTLFLYNIFDSNTEIELKILYVTLYLYIIGSIRLVFMNNELYDRYNSEKITFIVFNSLLLVPFIGTLMYYVVKN